MNKDNVKHVYDEFMGKIDHDRLGLRPSPLDWRANAGGRANRGADAARRAATRNEARDCRAGRHRRRSGQSRLRTRCRRTLVVGQLFVRDDGIQGSPQLFTSRPAACSGGRSRLDILVEHPSVTSEFPPALILSAHAPSSESDRDDAAQIDGLEALPLRRRSQSRGHGIVYRAHDRVTGLPVAIKVLKATLAENPVQHRRLAQEFRAAVQLEHPNIVRAIEIYSDGKTSCLVFEFVEGEDLAEKILKGGPLPEDEAIHIITQIAQALHYAHRRQVIHRDVSRDNILVLPDGRAS